LGWEFGIGISNWELGFGLGIKDLDWNWGLGIRIEDGLGLEIEIGKWD